MISLKKVYEAMLKEPELTSKDVDSKELEMGIKIEMEHTTDPKVAKMIALHHLQELPDYYTRLIKMEKEGEMQKQNKKENK